MGAGRCFYQVCPDITVCQELFVFRAQTGPEFLRMIDRHLAGNELFRFLAGGVGLQPFRRLCRRHGSAADAFRQGLQAGGHLSVQFRKPGHNALIYF